MSTTEISISANITKLRQELAMIPNITDKEAKAMSSALVSQMKKSEKAAKKAAQGSSKAWKGFTQEVNTTSKSVDGFTESAGDADSVIAGVAGALDLVNPALGDMARVAGDSLSGVESLGRAIKFSNPVFLVLAATAAALGAAYFYLTGESEDAEAATKALKEEQEALKKVLGGSAVNVQTYAEQVAVLNGEMSAADAEFRAISRSIVAGFSGDLEKAETKLDALKETLAEVSGSYDSWNESVSEHTARTKVASDAVTAQQVAISILGNAERKEQEAAAEWIATKKEQLEQTEAATRAEKIRADGLEKAKKTVEEIAAAEDLRISTISTLTGISESSGRDQLSALELIQSGYQSQIDKINELVSLYPNDVEMKALSETAKADATTRAARDMYAELGKQTQDHLDEQDELDEEAAARKKKRADEVAEAELKALSEVAAAKETAIAMVSSLESTAASWSTKLAEDGSEKSKALAWKAFEISKAAGIADVAITTAQSVMKIASQTGIWGAPLIAGTIALGAAQAGLISMQSPSFHAGGMIGHGGQLHPDETQITARQGEGVVSQSGMNRLGKSGLDALNRGTGGGSQIIVTQQYQHRSFGAFIQKDIQQPNSPLRKAIRGENRVGHKSRRI